MRTSQRGGREGFFLIAVIIAFFLVTVLCLAIIPVTTTAMYNRVLAGNSNRAYALAESGGEYAIERFRDDGTVVSGMHTLQNGRGSFTVTVNTNGNPIVFESIGIVSEGTGLEARRKVTYELRDFRRPGDVPVDFDADGDGKLDDTWSIDQPKADIVETGKSDKSPALLLAAKTGDEASISLDWTSHPELNLIPAWLISGELLSYDMQVKVSAQPQSATSQGNFGMVGLSFRLDGSAGTTYGVSYFIYDPTYADPKKTPTWLATAQGFDGIKDGRAYVVLWKETGNVITRMDSRVLEEGSEYGNVVGINKADQLWVEDWSTLMLNLDEEYDADGNRVNHISVYVQGEDLYARNGPKQWDPAIFKEVSWSGGSQPILDATFTSANFDTRKPAEIGVHAFYDTAASQQLFFDDFGLRVEGFGGGQAGNVIQY